MRMPNNSDFAIVSPEETTPAVKPAPRAPIRREDGLINYGFGFVEPLPHDRVGFDRRTAAQIAHDEFVKPGPAIVLAGGGTANLPSLQQQHAEAAADFVKTIQAVPANYHR